MRTKNGKWIGPVPIVVVAALALAAFLSVGLWLLPDGSSPTYAQGLSLATAAESTASGDECGVSIDGTLKTVNQVDMRVAKGDCIVSGDSVDVVFENTAVEPTGGDNLPPDTVDLVVYVTGGNDFASVQARDNDEALLGARGVDEYLFTLGHQTTSFGTTTPGTEKINVTRSMAGEDGKVYVFAYYNNDDGNVAGNVFQVINGRIDVDGDGAISGADDRVEAEGASQGNFMEVGIINGEIDIDMSGTITEADDLDISGSTHQIIDGALYEVTTGDSPVSLGNTVPADGATPTPIKLMNGLADVDGDGIATNDIRNPTAGDDNDVVTSNSGLAVSRITNGEFDINDDGSINEADDYAITGTQYLIIDGVFWGPMTGPQPTGANFVPAGYDQDTFDRASPLNIPFAPGREGHFAGFGPKNTVAADIVVEVQFLDNPALGEDGDDEDDKVSGAEVRSKLTAMSPSTDTIEVTDGSSKTLIIAGSATGATITATVQDKYGNPIKDATVTFVATSVPATVESSSRTDDTTDEGVATREISKLPAKGPFKVTVVATVGDLELGTIVIAKAGPLDRVAAASCTTLDEDAKVKNAKDACGANHDPQMVVDPNETITIVAKAVDSLDSPVTPTYTLEVAEADEDNFGTPGRFSDGVASIKVDDEAASGEYMLTVKAEQGSGDSKITKTTEVEVIVTGELDHYAIKGNDRIQPREVEEFVVEAQDERGNPAQFDDDQLTDAMHEVSIFVDGDTDMVSVLDLEASQKGDLALKNTTFRIRALPGASGEIEISVLGPQKGGVAAVSKTIKLGVQPTAPGMPMNPMATATSHTDITVSWEAPASNGGSAITSYIIERAYGDVMFLNHADAMGDVFTDAMSWWDGLGCEAMVQAVNDDGVADANNPFCKMYDDLDEASTMTVDEYFMKRYAIIEDPMMMSYMDMMLMPDTEYSYRINATNEAGAGMWSDTAMATTEAVPMNQAPTAPTVAAVTLMEGGSAMTVDAAFTDPEGGMLTYEVSSDDEMVATATVDDMGMVTITPMGAGPATITVTATDPDMAMATVDIMVTVEASAPVLMAPTNVGALSFLAGQVSVAWQPGQDAFGHLVVLFDSANSVAASMTLGPSADSHTFADVAAGDYSVVVVSFRSGSEYELASGVPVTVR